MNLDAMKTALTRRSFLKTAGVAGAGIASAYALGGCDNNRQSASAANATELSLVLDYTPNTNHTGIYVAQSLGYYAEEGISLTIVSPPEDGADALIGAGSVQLGISYQDVMANYLASSTPLPYTAIGAIVQHNTSGIMSRQEDGITRPRAMEGHQYATWNQDVEQAMIRDIMTFDGGDYSKIDLVPYAVDDEVAGLRSNAFDCVWVYEGWAVQNASLQNFAYSYFPFIDYDDSLDYYTPVIAANNEFLAKNADTTRAFMRATRRGYEYAASNPSDAARILVEAVPELDAQLVAKSAEYLAGKYIDDASEWGYIDKDRWARFYQWLNDNGLVETTLDVDAGFTNDYLD